MTAATLPCPARVAGKVAPGLIGIIPFVLGFARADDVDVRSSTTAEVADIEDVEDVEESSDLPWRPPPYFDYDCDRLPTSEWDDLYKWVEESVVLRKISRDKDPDFQLRAEFAPLLEAADATPVESMQCPIGVLFLRMLRFYAALHFVPHGTLVALANGIQGMLSKFPMYAIALSRWPVFHALDYLGVVHPQQPSLFCSGVQGVLDWDTLREDADRWAYLRRGYAGDPKQFDDEIDALELGIGRMFFTVLHSRSNHHAAYDECPFGFYFLTASQVVAAARKDTQHLPNFNTVMEGMFRKVEFVTIASCGWPIFAVLHIFADLNKGNWFWEGGDRKYLRSYSDWNLRRDELSPLLPQSLDFLTPEWRSAAEQTVEELVQLPASSFAAVVQSRVLSRENDEGPMRPILLSLVAAALAVAEALAHEEEVPHRLVYVVLLYGSKWAEILALIARRLEQLSIQYPLFAIAIGEEAAAACRRLSEARGGTVDGHAIGTVVCWTPDSPSQVHRFTAIHALLHLGIDVIYMDMDTFLLRDPTNRILSQAAGYDALFASHADADCINIGVFFLRARASTAIWFSQFVAWYHDHPFEVDQRGLHVFLGLPAKNLSIAYVPDDLVQIKGGILDDVNEIVIGDIGWHGNLSKLLIMHWCHRPIAEKEEEIRDAYAAAEVAHRHGLPLSGAVSSIVGARRGTIWEIILKFRTILEDYRRSAPPLREPCW